ncbi:MAG: hypothetical protein LBE71_06695 [Dysgonamonadaceae bacterium]|jgi:hypothetical protein|nr:hypothetical protein [Dysgonamonadaceae bacterium]
MLKQLYLLLSGLVVSPAKTWKTLAEKHEPDNGNFYRSYLYPIIGMIALLSFTGIMIQAKDFQFQSALKIVIKETIAYFGGFYLAANGLFRLSGKYFGLTGGIQKFERFTGYASAVIYAVACLDALIQSLFYTQIFILYTAYIVWNGSRSYMAVKETYLTKFTIFASAIFIISPVVVRIIMTLIMPGLR